MVLPVLLMLFGACTARASEEAVVLREFVFERAPFPESHASTVIELADRTLMVAWFGGSSEGENDVRIWTARKPPGSDGFEAPVAVAAEVDVQDSPVPTWNPVLFQPSEGPLLLFYKAGPSPREWWGMVKRSTDGGRSWSSGQRLPEGMLGPIRAKPLELDDGTLLFGSSTEHDGWRVHFERADAELTGWQRTEDLSWEPEPVEAIQPTFLRYADGRIQALCRSQNGRIVESWSEDEGLTWTPLRRTVLPNPSAGIDAVTLADGRQLLVYNHQERDQGRWAGSRRRLDLASTRDGLQWSAALELENDPLRPTDGSQPGEYSYPAAIVGSNGLVHVTYTWRRQRIRHVVVDPAKLELRPMPGGAWPEP